MFSRPLCQGTAISWTIARGHFLRARITEVNTQGSEEIYKWREIIVDLREGTSKDGGEFSGSLKELHEWFLNHHPLWMSWEVKIDHPHGVAWIPAIEWMLEGPGPRRLLEPSEMRDAAGNKVPLSAIPLRYRNTRTARFLKSVGLLENTWPEET